LFIKKYSENQSEKEKSPVTVKNRQNSMGNDLSEEIDDAQLDHQTLMEKYDTESQYRKQTGSWWFRIIFVISVLMSFYQLYTAIFGTLPSSQQRGYHLALGLGLAFLLYPGNKIEQAGKVKLYGWVLTLLLSGIAVVLYLQGEITSYVLLVGVPVLFVMQLARNYTLKDAGIPVYDVILSLLAFGVGFYRGFFYEDIISRVGMYNDMDYIVAAVAVLLVLEAARRLVGMPIVVVGLAMLAYAYLGPYMPGFLQHRGFGLERIITYSFLSLEGILGIPIAISATFIYLYLLFGVVLQNTGIEKFFSDMALALTGWMTGGTAKATVISSAFQGTVTGSSVANTVGSGAFTIPLMKRAGYTPEFAAAVEASSSTGGQIMPPIMGAAAFLMIEFTGLPYSQIIVAALVPALLFFAGEFIAVHYESKKLGILGIPRSELPGVMALLMKKGYLLLPLVAIIVVLSIGQSPMRAAWVGIAVAFAMNILAMIIARFYHIEPEDKMTLPLFFKIMAEGARAALPVIAACAAAGIIVGVVTLTGLGLKMAGGILDLAGHKLFLTMLFTMVACIFLGMGLPTTVNYVITATMAAPALLAFDGVPVIAAHLFVFYFGIVADITPPVALAAYAGAGIARSNPFLTGIQAVKVAIGAFLVPYMFALSPVLVLHEAEPLKLTIAIVTALIGMAGVSSSLVGYLERHCFWWERVLLFLGGISLVHGGLFTDAVGLAVLLIIYTYQKVLLHARKKAAGKVAGQSPEDGSFEA